MSTALDKLDNKWRDYFKQWGASIPKETYARYMMIVIVPKKVSRIRSARRRKLAISRLPHTIYEGCYPINVSEISQPVGDLVNLEVTFNFEGVK